ncbi:hypothetical protein [Actinospica robiniae]|uniref:hypothetical protein n=1 Tax=Actinospica robiniae TaxID=304901 RepID=UPI000412F09A|nr:hypothetical protein [Actinospica robiniae]
MSRHASDPPRPDDEAGRTFSFEIEVETPLQISVSSALVLAEIVGAWALAEFAQQSLGLWRFALAVPLVLIALVQGLLTFIALAALIGERPIAPNAPRWLRVAARYLGYGLGGMLLADLVMAGMTISYPQPRPWIGYVSISAAAFVVGVASGIKHRRRRRARLREERSS